jgi:small-conductance mechanosensitive channel
MLYFISKLVDIMIEKVHQHIVNELQQSSRTDTIFVVTAVLFNLIVLAINWSVASDAASEKASSSDDFVLIVFIIMAIIVNIIAISALYTGKNTRNKLLQGLLSMYRDNEVDKYYDSSLLTNYGKRYFFFTAVITCLVIMSVIVPIVIRFL